MGERKDAALAFQKLLVPAGGHPSPPQRNESECRLEVAVVFTSVTPTIAALKEAGAHADRLRVRINLVVPQIVPYPLPLESPPVMLDFCERRFREIAAESRVETTVQIYLCRDRLEMLKSVLTPRSLVVIGGRKRWWPTREKSLVQKLRRAGHEVIFTEMRSLHSGPGGALLSRLLCHQTLKQVWNSQNS
jgi:hypothetical protein